MGVNVRANVAAFQQALAEDRLDPTAVDARFLEVAGRVESIAASVGEIERRLEELDHISAKLEQVSRRTAVQIEAVRHERDDAQGLKSGLKALRESPEHAAALAQREPLVSVRIAAYENTEALIDVAIASVLRQTYSRVELIVVNDGPNDTTRRAIENLDDARIRYYEFPERNLYPQDSHFRWMVAGAPGMNRGADLASGTWIAPLDDDDEFTDDHIEKLVALATREQVELAYGALLQRNRVNGDEHHIFSSPPEISQFSFQGAIYLARLRDVFRYDEQSWVVGEPGDWNLIRRMKLAGVTMASTPDVVAYMNQVPYTHKPANS